MRTEVMTNLFGPRTKPEFDLLKVDHPEYISLVIIN